MLSLSDSLQAWAGFEAFLGSATEQTLPFSLFFLEAPVSPCLALEPLVFSSKPFLLL